MTELKNRLFQFVSLVIYVQVLNIPFLLILHLFIKESLNFNYEFISLDKITFSLFVTCIYALFQTVILPLRKTYSLIVCIILHNLVTLEMWRYNDIDPFGGELVFNCVSEISNFVELLFFSYKDFDHPFINVLNKLNWTLVFSGYLCFIYFSFKYLLTKLSKHKIGEKETILDEQRPQSNNSML